MYATGNKKMLNMLILDILKEYSDQDHRLTQQEIIRLLKANYDMDCDRRSVKNNVLCLKELGYEISMEEYLNDKYGKAVYRSGCLEKMGIRIEEKAGEPEFSIESDNSCYLEGIKQMLSEELNKQLEKVNMSDRVEVLSGILSYDIFKDAKCIKEDRIKRFYFEMGK